MNIGFRPSERKEGTDMYDNDLYSGEGAGTNTSGANSQQNQNNMESNNYNSGASGESSRNNSYSDSYGSDSYSSYNFGTGNSGSGNSGQKNKEKKSGGFFKKAAVSICMGLFFGLFAGVGFYGVQYLTGSMTAQDNPDAPVISNDVENQTEDMAADDS